jgi:hypothetical protein
MGTERFAFWLERVPRQALVGGGPFFTPAEWRQRKRANRLVITQVCYTQYIQIPSSKRTTVRVFSAGLSSS